MKDAWLDPLGDKTFPYFIDKKTETQSVNPNSEINIWLLYIGWLLSPKATV